MVRAAMLAALVALSGAAARTPEPIVNEASWDEIAWPFPRDAWPAGHAYRCRGCDLEVYVRPKLGFCNCTTGVTDDSEVDAVADLDMITPDFAAGAPGRPLTAAGLHGRARSYTLRLAGGIERLAAGIALSSKCDLLVAAATGRDAADQVRIAALLDSPAVRGWTDDALGRAPARLASGAAGRAVSRR